jgi:MFS transporter, BCD family, chlorophyll transporter
MNHDTVGWVGIVRMGLVQASIGAVVVLATSTMNRVMVVELALPAAVPGALVAWHYAVQMLRPRLGYGSDVGGRRAPWIVGGMAILALGAAGAAASVATMRTYPRTGVALAIISYTIIGIGVGAAGTSLLVLLSKRVAPRRRAAAATIVWIMLVAGFVITASVAGQLLDPFSSGRLVEVTAAVATAAFIISLLAVWGVENTALPAELGSLGFRSVAKPSFRSALSEVWAEPQARRFTIFVFVSMLAYSAQELIFEPFAGAVFGLGPAESTRLTGVLHAGALTGMLLAAVVGSAIGGIQVGSMRISTVGGCFASAAALLAVAGVGIIGTAAPLRGAVFVLGVANGSFAVAAIGAMMQLAGSGREAREGIRMGLWGAAQAIAFAVGGLAGTVASDLARHFLSSPGTAYAMVFAGAAVLFSVAAGQAARVFRAAANNDGLLFAVAGQVSKVARQRP